MILSEIFSEGTPSLRVDLDIDRILILKCLPDTKVVYKMISVIREPTSASVDQILFFVIHNWLEHEE